MIIVWKSILGMLFISIVLEFAEPDFSVYEGLIFGFIWHLVIPYYQDEKSGV